MKTINLRKYYYPYYTEDVFVEVSDEVWEAMRQAEREMYNYDRRKVYHRAYYSLDAYSWTENYALEHGRSPEEILMEQEERTARFRLAAALPEALAPAPPPHRAAALWPIISPVLTRRKSPGGSVSAPARSALPSGGACGICAATMTHSQSSEVRPMQTVNLKEYYYPLFTKDTFVEVSDEVAEALLLMHREENNRIRKMYYHKAYFSLDREDGIENDALCGFEKSPEEIFMEQEEERFFLLTLERLKEALSCLTLTQQRRIRSRYLSGRQYRESPPA